MPCGLGRPVHSTHLLRGAPLLPPIAPLPHTRPCWGSQEGLSRNQTSSILAPRPWRDGREEAGEQAARESTGKGGPVGGP